MYVIPLEVYTLTENQLAVHVGAAWMFVQCIPYHHFHPNHVVIWKSGMLFGRVPLVGNDHACIGYCWHFCTAINIKVSILCTLLLVAVVQSCLAYLFKHHVCRPVASLHVHVVDCFSEIVKQ